MEKNDENENSKKSKNSYEYLNKINKEPNSIGNIKPEIKQDIAARLKENIKLFFLQLKFGCSRKFCYNKFCQKSLNWSFNGGDKEILTEAIKIAKNSDCEKLLCKQCSPPSENYLSIDVETFALSFEDDENYLKNNFNNFFTNSSHILSLPKLNFSFEKLSKYESHKDGIGDVIVEINKYFSKFLEKEVIKEEESSYRKNFYSFYIYTKIFLFISINSNFIYMAHMSQEYYEFFRNFKIILKNISQKSKLYMTEKDYFLSAFVQFKSNPGEFSSLVNNFQNFLALIIYQTEDIDDEEEERNENNFLVLIEFMKIFKLLYKINEHYQIISYKEFYNGGVSTDLNLKNECQTYMQILNKAKDSEKLFCLIKYHWLFDPAAKSEILYIFNYQKQRSEILNGIMSMQNLQFNPLSLNNMFLYMEIRRDNIIEDTLNFISNPNLNFKKQLRIKFSGEQGVDEGGVKKEFFILLIRQLFDPDYGMFTYNEQSRYFWFNPNSFEPKIKFELIGVILGLAFFNNVILDIKFPLVIYKKLLGLQTNIDDLKEIDEDLYKNFKFLQTTQEKDLEEKLCTTFTVIVDQFWMKEVIPLKENGENIFINEENREEYVSLYLDWYFNKHIEHVFCYFKQGFYRVCDNQLFHMLRPEELELIICGTKELDFYELEKSSQNQDGFDKDSQTIKNLWEVIHSLSLEEKKQFLFFVTGCDRAPINGLGSLIITVSRFGPDSDKLPCAHTCFNHLLLPDYSNIEKLRERLLIAINNSEGFGLI